MDRLHLGFLNADFCCRSSALAIRLQDFELLGGTQADEGDIAMLGPSSRAAEGVEGVDRQDLRTGCIATETRSSAVTSLLNLQFLQALSSLSVSTTLRCAPAAKHMIRNAGYSGSSKVVAHCNYK